MISTRAPANYGNQAKTQEFCGNSSQNSRILWELQPKFCEKLNISASPVSYDAQKVAKKAWVNHALYHFHLSYQTPIDKI